MCELCEKLAPVREAIADAIEDLESSLVVPAMMDVAASVIVSHYPKEDHARLTQVAQQRLQEQAEHLSSLLSSPMWPAEGRAH